MIYTNSNIIHIPVMACLYFLSLTSPAAYTPGIPGTSVESGLVCIHVHKTNTKYKIIIMSV